MDSADFEFGYAGECGGEYFTFRLYFYRQGSPPGSVGRLDFCFALCGLSRGSYFIVIIIVRKYAPELGNLLEYLVSKIQPKLFHKSKPEGFKGKRFSMDSTLRLNVILGKSFITGRVYDVPNQRNKKSDDFNSNGNV